MSNSLVIEVLDFSLEKIIDAKDDVEKEEAIRRAKDLIRLLREFVAMKLGKQEPTA